MEGPYAAMAYQPSRIAEAVLLVSIVLLFGMLAWVLNRIDRSALPATTTTIATDAQTVVADQPMLVADAPTASPYPPPPYPLPSAIPSPVPEPSIIRNPEDGYGVVACGRTPLKSDIKYWTEAADVIALGTVVEVPPTRWTTPDGARPANPHTADETIYNPVVIEVEDYLKVQQPTQQLGVFGRGGQIGQDRVDYCGDTRYTFVQGERVVVFLSSPSIWEERYDNLLLWEVAEHYTIEGGRVKQWEANPAENPSLEELRSMIEAAQEP